MKKPICVLLIISLLLSFGICNLSFASDYMLAPGDQLEVRIIGQKDLDTKQDIAPDGTISLPLLGRISAQNKTLTAFDSYLSSEFAKYIKNPQVVVYLTPRPIYIVQHNLRNNTWDVKSAKSIDEAKAFAGPGILSNIEYGKVYTVAIGKAPDWWEDNWYKVLTATAVGVGIYHSLR